MILYVKSGCSWCVSASDYLRKKGYAFEEIDVYRDTAAYETMKQISGQSCAPTLRVGDLVLADFDTGQLQVFLDKHSLLPE